MKKIFFFFFAFTLYCPAQSDTAIVALNSIDSTIIQDVRYATRNNFTGKVLYPTGNVFIRKIVGEKLSLANKYLKEKFNLKIKIFDGYRPLSVQKQMWELVPDPRYVADPAKGSRHNRGAAVDITLVDSLNRELDMGTEYDNFTERAHYDFPNLTAKQRENRKLLREVMMKFGFEPLETEWWHFDYKGWKRFSVLDIKIN